MRRSIHCLPAALTIAASIAALPAVAHAQGEPVTPAEGATPPEPAPTTAPTTESPPGTTVASPPTAALPTSASTTTSTPAAPATTTPSVPTTGPSTSATTQPEASAPPPSPTVSSNVPTTTEPVDTGPAPDDHAPDEATPEGDVADEDELTVDAHELLPDGIVRPITFPVLGPVQYGNDWGACREGCTRRHQGTDLIGVRMQPLLSAVDGTVTRLRSESRGIAGTVITVTGADGWYYNYFHINNDTPGTDDGAAASEWRIAPGLTVGSPVRAGQVIAYMGDSGNAEGSVPHLHFEIRRPDRVPVNPYHSLRAAQARSACSIVAGQPIVGDPAELSSAAVAVIPLGDGGRWLIDRDGRLFVEGSTAEPWRACEDSRVPVNPPAQPQVAPMAVAPLATAEAGVSAAAAPASTAPVTDAPTPAPTWLVGPRDSLWEIVQETYGVSDVGPTVSLVNLVFDTNRDQLADPNMLDIGMVLRLPAS